MNKIKNFIKKIYHLIIRPELKILPGNIAFFIVLSVIPIITLIGIIASAVSIETTSLENFMNQCFPTQISAVLAPYFSGQGVNFNVIICTIMGFILASNGTHAIIIATNKLYNIEEESSIKRRIKAFNLIFLLVMLIIFMLLFLAFGGKIVNFLTNHIFINFKDYIYYLYLVIKWPLGFMFIFFAVKIIYTISPDVHIKSNTVNKGSIFTTIMWILVTYIYGYYVTNIADYNLFYGNLSNIIILMLWIYIISYILVIGMVINVSSNKNSQIK